MADPLNSMQWQMGLTNFSQQSVTTPGQNVQNLLAVQYQQNMAGIRAQSLSPFGAQMMGGFGNFGGVGFNTGMMPNPAMMTTPNLGIYRQQAPMPMPGIAPFQQMPVFPHAFAPMPQPGAFTSPADYAFRMHYGHSLATQSASLAVPSAVAHAGTDMMAGRIGGALGSMLGSRFGPGGAALGRLIGGGLGVLGAERFDVGQRIGGFIGGLNPAHGLAVTQAQLMGMSPSFVTGGSMLNGFTGRGMSTGAALEMARRLDTTAFSNSFQRETSGRFSAQDLHQITALSGREGMLQGAQDVGDMHQRVVGIAKTLSTFMRLANEPSVTEAISLMGNLRRMGFSGAEMTDVAREARLYSRMAGTTVKGVMEAGGSAGAWTFQNAGLSGALGMRVGVGALGMAQAAANAGTFSPQQLAMLGGVQGIAQRQMESSAAFLQTPMMTAAMARFGGGGQFGIDGRALGMLATGGMNLNQMASMGAGSMLDAVRRGGIGAIGMMQMQQSELQDQMGRMLGPAGLQSANMMQIMNVAKMMGMSGPGGFVTAGMAMGRSSDEMKQLLAMGSDSRYWNNLRQQTAVARAEDFSDDLERRRERHMGATREWWSSRADDLSAFGRRVGRDLLEFDRDLWGTPEERAAASRGQYYHQLDEDFRGTSDAHRRRVEAASVRGTVVGGRTWGEANWGLAGANRVTVENLRAMQGKAFRSGTLGRLSALADGVSADEMDELSSRYNAAGIAFSAAQRAGAEDIVSADASVAAKLGISAERYSGLMARVGGNVARQYNRRDDAAGWFKDGGALTLREFEDERRRLFEAEGLDVTKLAGVDVSMTAIETARAGVRGGGDSTAFQHILTQSGGPQTAEEIKKGLQRAATSLFGESAKTADGARELMGGLLADGFDDDVSAAMMLIAAGQEAKAQEAVGPQKYLDAVRAVKGFSASKKEAYAAAGKRLMAGQGGDVAKMKARVRADVGDYASGQKGGQYLTGLGKVGAGNIGRFGTDVDALINSATREDITDDSVWGAIKKARGPGATAADKRAVENLIYNIGSSDGTGGVLGGDAKYDVQDRMNASAAAAFKDFPATSVKLDAAAKQMNFAADKMIKYIESKGG